MKILSYLSSKVSKEKTGAIDAGRIPDPLKNAVENGKYIRKNPYPLKQIVQDFQSKPFVTKNTKIVVMGSCFAQEINQWLEANGYACQQHVWGVVYTPQSIAQIVRYSFERNTWHPVEPFWVIDNKYLFPYLKANNHKGPKYLGEDETTAREKLESHFKQSAKLLKEAELVYWNIGLTELWRNKQDHMAFFAIPYPEVYDAEKHEFYNLKYQDVIDKLGYAIDTLKEFNPHVKIIISVEPVPLSISFRPHIGPYIATQYSKSVLMAGAMALIEKYDDVFYMPAYEIIRNNHQAYYWPDGRHINKDGINAIMKSFEELYVFK
ncbi:GSCFA domain-containing protein [bacterium]|nr:GSCFA domain-containing protein [bacterium]